MVLLTRVLRAAYKVSKKDIRRLTQYNRHFPQKYLDKVRGTLPSHVYGNRFGLPDKNVYEGKTHIDPNECPRIPQRQNLPTEEEVTLIRKRQQQIELARALQSTTEPSTYIWERNQRHLKEYVENASPPIPDDKWMIFPGDQVVIMVGKDKGESGEVTYVDRALNAVYVRGRHLVYQQMPHGNDATSYRQECPLDVAAGEVMLRCPISGTAAEYEWRMETDGDMFERVNVETDQPLPIPEVAETYFYEHDTKISNDGKDESNKVYNTPAETVTVVSYRPTGKLFEDDILEQRQDT